MNSGRLALFSKHLESVVFENKLVKKISSSLATKEDVAIFHDPSYIERVARLSAIGEGYLDAGDTPAFRGVFEASLWVVGTTLACLDQIMQVGSDVIHVFNPVGGLHHAWRSSAGGFCVFNDAAIAIEHAHRMNPSKDILYIDIDAHHGDGVYYCFEDQPWLYIVDVHEDGRYLYPGTGFKSETGIGAAKGTKMNLPLPPHSGDKEFEDAFSEARTILEKVNPSLVVLQTGADGLAGDPLTHLNYSGKVHRMVAEAIHEYCHKKSGGRLLVLGGGGYNPNNVRDAWVGVIESLIKPIDG